MDGSGMQPCRDQRIFYVAKFFQWNQHESTAHLQRDSSEIAANPDYRCWQIGRLYGHANTELPTPVDWGIRLTTNWAGERRSAQAKPKCLLGAWKKRNPLDFAVWAIKLNNRRAVNASCNHSKKTQIENSWFSFPSQWGVKAFDTVITNIKKWLSHMTVDTHRHEHPICSNILSYLILNIKT